MSGGRRRKRRRSRRSRAAPRSARRTGRAAVVPAAAPMSISAVREALVASETCSPPVSRRPASFRPCRRRGRRRPRELRPVLQRPGDLAGAEIGIEQQPGLRWTSASCPCSFSRAQIGGARSCQNDPGPSARARPPRPEDDRPSAGW
jgi:hypothetical protein